MDDCACDDVLVAGVYMRISGGHTILELDSHRLILALHQKPRMDVSCMRLVQQAHGQAMAGRKLT